MNNPIILLEDSLKKTGYKGSCGGERLVLYIGFPGKHVMVWDINRNQLICICLFLLFILLFIILLFIICCFVSWGLMWLRLVLNSWSSCLYFQSVKIIVLHPWIIYLLCSFSNKLNFLELAWKFSFSVASSTALFCLFISTWVLSVMIWGSIKATWRVPTFLNLWHMSPHCSFLFETQDPYPFWLKAFAKHQMTCIYTNEC